MTALGVLAVGASLGPYGIAGVFGVVASLVGTGLSLYFALSSGDAGGGIWARGFRIGLAVVGTLFLWAGVVSSATAVAGYFHSRQHESPYTAGVEILAAGICALIGPVLLVLGMKGWPNWDNRTRAVMWGYWLAFFPATALATALAALLLRPRG
jgi:hypothetical protein